MRTPILDFVRAYAEKKGARLHMPGHKGKPIVGPEAFDITEIDGADVLYNTHGIIAESERNASLLFDTGHTYFSAEGSSLAIKAMLALAISGKPRARILAGRNAHKVFLYAAALLDFEIDWIGLPEKHICESVVTAQAVESVLSQEKYDAVYLTSPDYLGHVADIEGIAKACKCHGVPLLVDNAHGAYLAFLTPSRHPIALGATMCADSAHKTLPALTGGAYLHIAKDAPKSYAVGAERMLSLFASTSPSYLILASLDAVNRYLAEEMREKLLSVTTRVAALKRRLCLASYPIEESEPLKLVLHASLMGYTGEEFAAHCRQREIELEYADSEYAVFMISTETDEGELEALEKAILAIERRSALSAESLPFPAPERMLSPREAILARQERVPVADAVGRACGAPTVSCPPAVPIVASGERIVREHLPLFARYGMTEIDVVVQ